MIRPILKWPSPVLKKVSDPVTSFGPELQELIGDLLETMYEAGGLGLSAIQVGVPLRVFVLDVGPAAEVYINPTWKPVKDIKRVYMNEGCLSVPGVNERVLRYPAVDVQYLSPTGVLNKFSTNEPDTDRGRDHEDIRRLRAQVIQHECEHLDGEIFLDSLQSWERERVRKEMKRRKRK